MERKPIKLPTVKQIQKMTVAQVTDIQSVIKNQAEVARVAVGRARDEYAKIWSQECDLARRINQALRGDKT